MTEQRPEKPPQEPSFLEKHRNIAQLVRDAERFAVRVPFIGHLGIPRPDELAYYGALAALVAFELIDWPVALAIAAGHVLATDQASRAPEAQPNAGVTTCRTTKDLTG